MQVKRIERHPNYIVGSNGYVYRMDKNGFHELANDYSNGYARVDLDGIKENVARLVLEAFKPTTNPEKCKVSYIDGDTTNCDLSNLVWLTQSEVMLYSRYTPEYRKQLFAQ